MAGVSRSLQTKSCTVVSLLYRCTARQLAFHVTYWTKHLQLVFLANLPQSLSLVSLQRCALFLPKPCVRSVQCLKTNISQSNASIRSKYSWFLVLVSGLEIWVLFAFIILATRQRLLISCTTSSLNLTTPSLIRSAVFWHFSLELSIK